MSPPGVLAGYDRVNSGVRQRLKLAFASPRPLDVGSFMLMNAKPSWFQNGKGKNGSRRGQGLNPNSEIRMAKEARNPNAETILAPFLKSAAGFSQPPSDSDFGRRICFGFRASAFGFRITGFGFNRAKACAWVCLGVLSALCVWVTGCQTQSSPEAPVYPGTAAYATNNLLEGDVVNIAFQYSTNFNTIQRIGLDGKLNLQGIGLVQAAGKTTQQLQNDLTSLYQGQVKDDPVTIKIVTAEAAIYVAGAVTRPGKIALERPMTVLEAVMEAGGYDPYRADLSNVLVLRVENGHQKNYRVNLRRVLRGQEDAPFYVKPFDVIQVATKTFNF